MGLDNLIDAFVDEAVLGFAHHEERDQPRSDHYDDDKPGDLVKNLAPFLSVLPGDRSLTLAHLIYLLFLRSFFMGGAFHPSLAMLGITGYSFLKS